MATLTTVANLDGTLATNIRAGLTFDAAGDLLGTTGGDSGTSNSVGSLFEVAKSATGYAATATTLAVFQGIEGRNITAGLLVDASGNLIGATSNAGHVTDGRPDGNGSVFEIAKTGTGYAATPTVLVGFNRTDGAFPMTSLIADAAGNLFGTTSDGGASGMGTVFEILKTITGYAASPTTLVSFDGADGARPWASLMLDSTGNLFGTAYQGGARGDGTVFEIADGSNGYAGGLITLSNFDSDQPAGSTSTDDSGRFPASSLVEDAAGDLFGTTSQGGSHDGGTVYEIAKTATGYASRTILVDLDPATGGGPGNLLIDAVGNLFGTAGFSDTSEGTVFEVAHTQSGYASVAMNLAIFTGANGGAPNNSLVADASGNLYGTTVLGGTGNHGTIFEVSGAGFQQLAISGTVGSQAVTYGGTLAPFSDVTIRDLGPGKSVTVTVTLSAAADGRLKNLGGGHYNARSGVYTDTGTLAQVTTALDGLRFTAASDPSSAGVRTIFTIAASDAAGGTATDATTTVDASNLVTLVGFSGMDQSFGPVVADASGDVFGIAFDGSVPRVFELAKASSGFASAPVTVASFGPNSGRPTSIVLDKAGDIFGTTTGTGTVDGSVFEIAKSSKGYASAPKILTQFTQAVGNPGALSIDAAGNLFGTKSPGTADSSTTVFELAKTNGGYAGTPATLATFAAANGSGPSQLTVDRAGNLFGTSNSGGDGFGGTIFEVAKTGKSYGPVITLASFDGTNGENPKAGVVADAAGDLFGTTPLGGPGGGGEVFELVRTATGYASDVTILASFGNGTSSEEPNGGVIVDAAGTVFGTTSVGGAYGNGAVFKIAKDGSGYASAPTTLVDFDKADGSYPITRLVGDAAGNLIGTTAFGGPGGNGTVFELKHAGFKTTNSTGQSAAASAVAEASSTGKTGDTFLLGGEGIGSTPRMAFLASGNHASAFGSGSAVLSGTDTVSNLLGSGSTQAAAWSRLPEPRNAYFGGAAFDSIIPQPALFHTASHNLL